MKNKRGGRPGVLGASDKIAIVNSIRAHPQYSCRDLQRHLGIQASSQSIRRYLKGQGYKYKLPVKKPKLSSDDKKKRLDWALSHRNFDFKSVVFADECSIWLGGSRQKLWMKKEDEVIIETQAYPGKVHV